MFDSGEVCELIKILVLRGASANTKSEDGNTLLHCACRCGDIELAKFLVNIGADTNAKHEDGDTPLHRAAALMCYTWEERTDIEVVAHFVAINAESLELVKFLIANGADVNAKGLCGDTPLHYAAKFGNIELVKFLVSKGAGINVNDDYDNTPLHGASGSDKVFKFLVANGADVNAKNKDGKTPLDYVKEEEARAREQSLADENEKWDDKWDEEI
jgi:ankyrin repeat protein